MFQTPKRVLRGKFIMNIFAKSVLLSTLLLYKYLQPKVSISMLTELLG